MVVHYHRGRDRAEETAAAPAGGRVLGADLTDEAEVARLFAAAGALDVCAAIAGVWPAADVPVRALSLERWRATLDANLTATFLTARGFLAQLGDREGTLVLVGSTAGIFGEAGHADYAAAKAAILTGLLLSLKNEVVRDNPRARVNAVAPGWTVSPMTRGSRRRPTQVRADLADDGAAEGRAAGGRRRAGGRARLARPLRPRHGPGGHRRRRHGGPRPATTYRLERLTAALRAPPQHPAARDDCRQSREGQVASPIGAAAGGGPAPGTSLRESLSGSVRAVGAPPTSHPRAPPHRAPIDAQMRRRRLDPSPVSVVDRLA